MSSPQEIFITSVKQLIRDTKGRKAQHLQKELSYSNWLIGTFITLILSGVLHTMANSATDLRRELWAHMIMLGGGLTVFIGAGIAWWPTRKVAEHEHFRYLYHEYYNPVRILYLIQELSSEYFPINFYFF